MPFSGGLGIQTKEHLGKQSPTTAHIQYGEPGQRLRLPPVQPGGFTQKREIQAESVQGQGLERPLRQLVPHSIY